MSEDLVQRFVDGLRHLEETHDPEPLLATFTEECETSTVATEHVFKGRDGARGFWRQYRGWFGALRSSFRNVIVAGDRAALEWATEGTGPTGLPFRYDGVSILELAADGSGIARFRAYFDPADLGHQLRGERVVETGVVVGSTPRGMTGEAPSG